MGKQNQVHGKTTKYSLKYFQILYEICICLYYLSLDQALQLPNIKLNWLYVNGFEDKNNNGHMLSAGRSRVKYQIENEIGIENKIEMKIGLFAQLGCPQWKCACEIFDIYVISIFCFWMFSRFPGEKLLSVVWETTRRVGQLPRTCPVLALIQLNLLAIKNYLNQQLLTSCVPLNVSQFIRLSNAMLPAHT